jgi:RNA polymerase sigma-70 factor (ECF subfamily)
MDRAEGMSAPAAEAQARATADAVARASYGKLIAFLAAHTRDVAAAEDALSDAFAAALENWPRTGCPDHPEAWLLTVARRRVIDAGRRQQRGQKVTRELELLAGLENEEAPQVPDLRLELMFACAHPAIERSVRAPLMLQVVLGINAATIASAFLVAPATMGQRLVRAKNRIREAGVPFERPLREDLADRLDAVLDAIYAAYAEGWADPGGTDAARRDLAEEAVYLGGVLRELLPREPEVLGLLALMLYAEARRKARRSACGDYVPLDAQDPSRWDLRMIDTAESLLRRAAAFGSPGRFQLEAALQSAHVHRRRSGAANWASVVALYDALLALGGSPVVAVNRAVAIAEWQGAEAALAALGALEGDSRLIQYQPYWAARAELSARAGRQDDARRAYELAIGLERDAAVRRFLQRRQAALRP